VALEQDLRRIAERAAVYAEEGEDVAGIVPAEPASGFRLYVCAYGSENATGWLVLDATGVPVADRELVRDAVSIAALCEVAEEAAFPGDLDELRSQLVALRIAEAPEGIAEAEDAARALQHLLGAPPHLASPERLDAIGVAARRLERALDPTAPSPFTDVLRSAGDVADALWRDVESGYLRPLD